MQPIFTAVAVVSLCGGAMSSITRAAAMNSWCVAAVLGFWMYSMAQLVVGDHVRPVLRFNGEGTFKILQVNDSRHCHDSAFRLKKCVALSRLSFQMEKVRRALVVFECKICEMYS